jgi:hypothetical protein
MHAFMPAGSIITVAILLGAPATGHLLIVSLQTVHATAPSQTADIGGQISIALAGLKFRPIISEAIR